MPSNPLHYLLVQRPRPSIEKEDYFMLVIPHARRVTFRFQDQIFYIASQHLTIYRKAIYKKNQNNKKVLTPIHHTVTAQIDDKEIVAHIYFGEAGNYLFTEIKQTKPEKAKISLNNDKDIFWQLNQTYARPVLDDLFEELIGEQKKIVDAKDKKLKALDEASTRSTTDDCYKNLLASTLKTLVQYEQWDFDPDYGIKASLEKYSLYLKTLAKKPAPVVLRKKKKNDDSVPKQDSIPTPVSHVEETKQEIPDVSTKTCDDLSSELQLREKILSQRLKDCSEEDIDQALSIIKQIDKTKRLIETALLIRLCIVGNVTLFKRHFAANLNALQMPLLCTLLPTCVYHGHVELFDYIFHQIRSRRAKYDLCSMPYVALYPEIIYAKGDSPTLLAIAYERRNLDFFKILLTMYNYKPEFANKNPLIASILEDRTDYAIALLEAGIDPNSATSCARSMTLFLDNLEGFDEDKKERALKSSITQKKIQENCEEANKQLQGKRPLHIAAERNNLVVIESLLKHGADTRVVSEDGVTPFGSAIYSGADRKIISLFLNKGHDIDERQTQSFVTGLLFACANKDLKLVQLLLEFKADPCAVHNKIKNINGGILPYHSPLFMALINNEIPILRELLKYPMKQRDLQFIHWLCKREKISISPLFIEKYVTICQLQAEHAKSTHNFVLAVEMYQEILWATNDREVKHNALYELAICLATIGDTHTAIIKLTCCINIRKTLASEPLKTERMLLLIETAKERLEEIEKSISAQNEACSLHLPTPK
jgi:hypothetical protein